MKVTRGNKLVVYIGGLVAPSDEKTENPVATYEEEEKLALSFRTELIEGLNQSKEVKDVSDLFDKLPPYTLFNPIVFRIHIPLSLQKSRYVGEEAMRETCEDFECVYDGVILFVAALCSLDKKPYGVFDVRDRATRILGEIVKIKEVAPCLLARPVSFVVEGDKVPEAESYVRIEEPKESRQILADLHSKISYELHDFYEICDLSHEIDEKAETIEKTESNLILNMRDFIKTGWHQILRKRDLTNKSKETMATILENISEYLSDKNLLKRKLRDFRILEPSSELFSQLINNKDLQFYGTPYLKIDTESVVKTVEHIRSELETYSLNKTALLSAIFGAVVGALIGSLITLLLSRL